MPDPTSQSPSLSQRIGRLCGRLAADSYPSGELAELRRLSPDVPPGLAFYKLAADAGLDLRPDDEDERRWSVVLAALATLRSLHDYATPLGKALGKQGLSELRFSRLLRAEPPRLYAEVRATAAWLASKGASADLADLAKLVLLTDPELAERHRRRLARHYYRNQPDSSTH